MPLIIANCTNIKRKSVPPDMHAAEVRKGSLIEVATEWRSRLTRQHELHPAETIYGGRSFQESMSAAKQTSSKLIIASAGLGLIRSESHVPCYACTIVERSPDSIADRVTSRYSKAAWWKHLTEISPYSERLSDIAAEQPGPILVALSEGYIEMMRAEFLALPKDRLRDVRLFSRAPKQRIPVELHPQVMPYDDRLDGPDSTIRGTRSDFAARAMRHFVESILPTSAIDSGLQHANAVEAALQNWAEPAMIPRRRLPDDEIKRLMHVHWFDAKGSSARLLRLFRDHLRIACEQSRFASLAREVRAEIENG